ncbi:MAG: cytochrome c oxidase assembly protein [Caldilineaceae bacterium]
MHPLLRALLSTWDWRWDILLVLAIFATLYTTGWWRLRKRSKQTKLANRARLAAYWGGLITLAVALMSPIDPLGGQLFFMHMVQHLLTIMVAAPLLWLGAPFPFLLWGLPKRARTIATQQFRRNSPLRSILVTLTQPAVSWLFFIAIYVGWHDPNFYDLALVHPWVHDLEHITFFASAMLLWWHVIGAGPHLHSAPIWGRIAMLIGIIPANMGIGIIIATADKVIYSYYATVPHIWGFTAVEDQSLAGVIMWIPGSMMLILAVLLLLSQALRGTDENPPTPVADWDRDEAMVAPGLEHRVVQNKWRRLKTPSPLHPSDVS